MLKKILSYLYPVRLKKYTTEYSGELTVSMFNGKKVLDTATANYSYGALQKALKQALKKLPFTPDMQQILVLGMGAGSVAATIRYDFDSTAHITMVEIDPAIISIAEQEFSLAALGNTLVINDDAASFVRTNTKAFDLIIVDLFIVDTVPEAFTQEAFLSRLSGQLTPGGSLVFNTIRDTLDPSVLKAMISILNNNGVYTRIIQKLFGTNDMILGKKSTNSATA